MLRSLGCPIRTEGELTGSERGSSSSRWQCAKNATELLNFRLLPRLKNIGSRRLHRPDDSLTDWRALGSSLTTR
ncbi:hypothetical protein K377_07820, partial [Streptomyces sp. PsTaAH-137]